MQPLTQMPNIGPETARQLNEVGIFTPVELAAAGSREAWLRILGTDPSACLNRLYGLEGALRGVRWHLLDGQTKADLKAFFREHKPQMP